MLLAVDIGGTSVKYGLWDKGMIGHTGSFKTPATLEAFMQAILETLTQVKAQGEISGLAISSPGAVDPVKGWVGGISAVPYIHGFPFVELLEDFTGLPVTIENDANCAILSEIYRGQACNYDNAVFLVIGTGIGGGYVINRQLVRGRNHASGEFGSMRLVDQAQNWSTIGSTIAMVNTYNQEHETEMDGRQIFEAYDQGETKAVAAVQGFYRNLAKGIYNLLMAFDPQVVFIGGGISSRPSFVEELRPYVKDFLLKEGLPNFEFDLQVCEFNEQSNLVGAVVHFMNAYPDVM